MGVDVLEHKPGYGRLRRRRIILLAVIGLAVIASIGGLLISTTIKSPAQQAAETKAPGLTRLTAPVQAGLESLGFSVGGDTSGVYGPGTSAAVAAFYQSLGYPAPAAPSGSKGHRRAEVPLSEIMFVPRFPAQVVKLGGHVGSVVSDSLVTLSLGSPSIHGQLNPAFGPLVRPGMRVTITTQGSPATVHGTIASVGRKAQTSKSISGGLYYPMHIKLRKPLPPSMGPGQNVILSIRAAQSSGPMLAVPEAALFGGQDGKDDVSKVTRPNAATRVHGTLVTRGDR